ncbi:MAG: LCP family protein [Coriobacteriia bacterium]|nr:LCP family protein [Coriobacteriia bacterium]
MRRQKQVNTQLTGYAAYSRDSLTYNTKTRFGMSTPKKILIGFLVALLVVVAAAGTAFGLYINQISNNLKGNYNEEETLAINEKLVPTTTVEEPFYVMLIGSDERANDDELGARSDSNILCRIDPTTWVVSMISIPRDTKITYKGSVMKFNAAYTYGGAAGVIEATTQLTGVQINHYVEVNFSGLEALVDAVGGVTVDVPQPINDPQAGEATIDEAGVQTLNGAQALVFARSRHYYLDGDFSRSANQRTLIMAIVNKVFSLPIGQIPGAVQEMSKCVSTDLTVNELYSLAMQYMNSGAQMTLYSTMAPSTTSDEGGASYVLVDTVGLTNQIALMDAGGDPSEAQISPGYTVTGKFEHYDYVEGYD